MNLRFRATALQDIDAIYTFRARQSLELAERVEAAIFATVDWLGSHPEFGTKTDEQEVRRWPMTDLRYTIFYQLNRDENALDVLRIMAGRQVEDLRHAPR